MTLLEAITSPRDREKRKMQRDKLSGVAPDLFGLVVPMWAEASNVLLTNLSHFLQVKTSKKITHLQGQKYDELTLILSGTQTNVCVKILQLLFSRFFDILVMKSQEPTTQFFMALANTMVNDVECCVYCSCRPTDVPGKAFYTQKSKFPTNKNYLQCSLLRMLKLLDCTQANNPILFVPYLEPFLGSLVTHKH